MTFKKNNIPWNKGKNTGLVPKSAFKKGRINKNKGKVGLPKHSEEHKRKISNKLKGRLFSDEHRKKLSSKRVGIKLSKETKMKISKSKQGDIPWNNGIKLTEEHKKKISSSNKGKKYPKELYPNSGWRNKHPSEEIKRKLRIATINYIKNICGSINPRIGHNEKKILDELESKLNYKIIRQYEIEGYFLDGYIKELNLAIEVDERPKNKERDIERQKIIEDSLGCKFLRIKDYD